MYKYTYDHVGRLKQTWKTIGGGSRVLLTENLYNDLGQLWQKKLHNGQQTTAYAYTPRGWLKSLSSGEFSEQLKYEDGSLAQYNGNISGQLWGSGSNLGQSFSYSYDALNRLVTASSPGLGESISYDGMGNILSLSRDGYGTNTYSNYNGNRLGSISGFVTGSYGYDANGNMTSAPGGLSMSYNNMNLPSVVSKGGVQSNYTYDYAGRKLRRSGGGSATRDYVDGIEYAGGSIDFIQTEEGIARRSGNTYNYEYGLKDHLGNTRYSFDIWNGGILRIQQQDYYAFGLAKNVYISGTKNNYLYNGKELQEQTGQYDYGARFYDPVVGRWNTIDPWAELGRRWSPYSYALNNPIRNIDPDGMWSYDVNGNASTSNPYEIKDFMRGSKAPIEIDSDRQNFDVFPDESSDLPNVDRFHNMDPHYIAGQYDPGKGKGKGDDRNPAQDKKLTPGEIKRLKDAGWDHSDKSANGKGGGQLDLWKDKDGNVYENLKMEKAQAIQPATI